MQINQISCKIHALLGHSHYFFSKTCMVVPHSEPIVYVLLRYEASPHSRKHRTISRVLNICFNIILFFSIKQE